jgi:hypothetical protein
MNKNMGAIDRLIRLIIGVVLAILVIAKAVTGVGAVIIGIVAIILLATGIFGFCGLYVPLKVSTLKQKPPEQPPQQ